MKLRYFSRLFESLAPVETPGLGTFGVTEHLVLMYDPAILNEWAMNKVSFVIAHEGMHVYNKHCMRGRRLNIEPGSHDAWLWNIAGDSQINRILREVFGWCPEDAVLPEKIQTERGSDGKEKILLALPTELHNATTEEIFVWLRKQKWPKEGSKKSSTCKGKCGSGAGHKIKGEVGPEHKASRGQGQVDRIIRGVAAAIKDAEGKSRGTVPAGLLRETEMLLEAPKVPWRRQLDRATRFFVGKQKGAVDYGWNGISKKQHAVGFGHGIPVLPKLYAPIASVDFVVDTSGSMSQHELGVSMREGLAVLKALGADVCFTAIDAEVHEQKRVRTIDEMLPLLKGGGGTDFRPYFKTIEQRKKRDRPGIIIFATDGAGEAPATPPPGVLLIWLLVGKRTQLPIIAERGYRPVDYGTVIECKD